MSRLFFDVANKNWVSAGVIGTSFSPNQSIPNATSSLSPTNTSNGVAIAPIMEGIIAMLSGKVSAAITNGNNSEENPTIYVEYEDLYGTICAILYDSDTNTYKYEYPVPEIEMIGSDAYPVSSAVIIPRLVELLYNQYPEFVQYYNNIKTSRDFNSPDMIKICDLLFRQSLFPTNAFDISLDDMVKVSNICLEPNFENKPITILKDISYCMNINGTFTKIVYGASGSKATPTGNTVGMALASEGEIPKEFLTEAYMPKMPKDLVVRQEMVDIAEYIYASKDEEQPINNISLFGPTGSGKSFICKYLASDRCLNVPYFSLTCSGNKDESMFTGMYQNGDKGKTIFVNSRFADFIQIPCVIELVEMNSLDEDVILALNSFMDHDYGYLVTDDFKTIKRNPKCIVISTFNPGYAGTKTPNRSVVRRADWMQRIDKVSAEEIKSMIAAVSGADDKNIIDFVYSIYETTEKFISINFDTSDNCEVSMAEYGMCAKFLALNKKLGKNNTINIIENTIVNKLVSSINFDTEVSEELKGLLNVLCVQYR